MKALDPQDDRRAGSGERRRRDRGGRRRADWPEDAGLTACPTCGGAVLQSLGGSDHGEYLWRCPACNREFDTKRASRVLL